MGLWTVLAAARLSPVPLREPSLVLDKALNARLLRPQKCTLAQGDDGATSGWTLCCHTLSDMRLWLPESKSDVGNQ